jgi:thioredoxin 1
MHSDTRKGDAIRTLSASNFDSLVLAASGPVAVEFMSYSCAYCRGLESSLQQVAQRLGPQQPIYRVNVALEPTLATQYEVQGTPTLLLFRDGAEVGRLEGPPTDVDSLLQAVTVSVDQ